MRGFVSAVVAVLSATAVLAITNSPGSPFDVQRVIPGFLHQGITFTPNGDLWTTDGGNTVCVHAGAYNLPIGNTLTAADRLCGTIPVGAVNIVSSQTGRIYTINGNEIVRTGPTTFTVTPRWVNCGASHGIAIDPRDGAVFVSSVNNGRMWRIPNPDLLPPGVYQPDCLGANLYFDLGAVGYFGFDGITVGPDGKVYGAGYSSNRFVVVSAWSTATPKGTLIAANPTRATTPDGISICVDSGESFALVAMTTGSISRFALSGPNGHPVYQESTIATDVGGYLDFTAVDPKGCIWGTTLFGGALGMYRVTNKDGSCGCASPQVPDPQCDSDDDCAVPAGQPCARGVCLAGGICSTAPRASGAVCRASAGACDVVETCDGAAVTCPADGFAATGTTCRDADGACDAAETCSGASATCPDDGVAPARAVCRQADGPCDVSELCDGESKTCGSDGVAPANTECRAANGDCDVAEVCDGQAKTCPAEAFVSSGTLCRASTDACDAAEVCTGSSGACPADGAVAAGTECRAAVPGEACDAAEVCDGSSFSCPADGYKPAGTECRIQRGSCDAAEVCDGSSSTCPDDAFLPFNTVCRSIVGPCDVPEVCDGQSRDCPADLFRCSNTECRAARGPCDVAEQCTGNSAQCPVDKFKSARTTCRCANGPCDAEEQCTGSSAECPADGLKAAGAVCRAARGPCDAVEVCSGSSKNCPADAVKGRDAVCRDAVGTCDVAETCDGCSTNCPADQVKRKNTQCRAAAGECDIAEVCDGRSGSCPRDGFASSRTVCRDACLPCDEAETCTGSSATCPADRASSRGKVCRSADGPCDVAETCDGTAKTCPSNAFKPSGTECRAASNRCDVAEKCNGNSGSCPANQRTDYGYALNCGDTCYFCGNGLQQQSSNDRNGYSQCGGCSIGRCRSSQSLPWPACVWADIKKKCPNNQSINSVAFYKCNNGNYRCTTKFDGSRAGHDFPAPYDRYCN